MKLTFSIPAVFALGVMTLSAIPAQAGFFTTSSGETVLSYKWDGTVHYNVNTSGLRITGSAHGTVSNGIAAFSGKFSEKHNGGGECHGEMFFIPRRTATFIFDRADECPNSSETLEVELPTEIASGSQGARIMTHDPSNDPNEHINIRSTPGGSVITTVLSGELGWHIDTVGSWHKIRTDNGITGWMHQSVFVNSATR